MRADFFNEALISAMLVAAPQHVPHETGSSEPDLMQADILKDHLIALLDRAGRIAMQSGLSENLVEVADFAICAFIDEILLSSQTWNDRAAWQKRTLQLMRHGTATAGEEFYQILNTLLEEARSKKAVAVGSTLPSDGPYQEPITDPDRDQSSLHAVLEIFAICLSQGFTGMYYDNPRAIQNELNRIGEIIPDVKNRNQFFVFTPKAQEEERGFKQKLKNFLHRFDILDWLLWLCPILVTVMMYQIYNSKLNALLEPFLSGSGLS